MQAWIDQVHEKILAKYAYGARRAGEDAVIPYQGIGEKWAGPPMDGDAWWTNGFWPALMWQLYHASGEEVYRQEALRVQADLLGVLHQFTELHHDVGFQFLLSFGAEHRLDADHDAWVTVLHAATILAGRFNPNGFIRAWNGKGREGWAIIDCMMNLSLLYWASRETEDPRFAEIAMRHADMAIENFVRPDGSCNHIVILDPVTGKMLDAPGGQGYGPGSSWSRGQAWALYGFVLSHLNSGEARYLKTAQRVADYFIENIRADGLTDSDFRQPEGEERIDNIAAACAACGLIELSKLSADGGRYMDAALRMLKAIDTLSADWNPERCGILQKCTGSYHDDGAGRHINMVYGDYFFVEAVMKLRGMDIMPWK